MKGQHRLLGLLQIISASFCFGFLGIFGKLAFSHDLSVGELLSYRFVLASLLLWIILLLFRPGWIRISKQQLFISAGLGVFGYALFATLYFQAVKGLSVALAALLLYTYPLWVQVITFYLGEKPTLWQLFCTAMAFIGLIFLLWGQITVTSLAAFICGLGSAISYAIYIVVSGKFQNQIRPLTSSLYVMTFAALALVVFHGPSMTKLQDLTIVQANIILGIAIICTIIPMTLVLASLQKLKKTEVALLSMIEPLTAALASWILLQEKLSFLQLLGGALILGGLALRFRENVPK